MKGEIVIKTSGIDDITIAVKTTPLHKFEKLVLVDALCEALRFADKEERAIVGFTIAAGGLSAVAGVPAEQFEIDVSALKETLRRAKDKNSDTP